jgi:hypothetical protein
MKQDACHLLFIGYTFIHDCLVEKFWELYGEDSCTSISWINEWTNDCIRHRPKPAPVPLPSVIYCAFPTIPTHQWFYTINEMQYVNYRGILVVTWLPKLWSKSLSLKLQPPSHTDFYSFQIRANIFPGNNVTSYSSICPVHPMSSRAVQDNIFQWDVHAKASEADIKSCSKTVHCRVSLLQD